MRLVAALLFASALISEAADIAAGRWEGTIQIPQRELKVVIDLAQNNDHAWIGSIIIPGAGIKGAQLADLVVKGSEAAFSINNAFGAPRVDPAKFQAHLNAKGELAGNFSQAGNSASFALQQTGRPQVELPPQSTAIAKELEGKWTGEYELLGYPRHVTLSLTNHGASGASAEFVIVGKKTNNLPVEFVSQSESLLRVESHGPGINYEGRLGSDGNEIKGTLEQGLLEIPLLLRRAK